MAEEALKETGAGRAGEPFRSEYQSLTDQFVFCQQVVYDWIVIF